MLYIIIPTFNRKFFLKECLFSLYKQSYSDFKIIVVVDGSSDGTVEMIKNEFPEVILLQGDGSLWWTGAINMGIAQVINENCDYILTLNDDLEIPFNYLSNLIEFSIKNPNSLIGSISLNYESRTIIDFAGFSINWKTGKKKRLYSDCCIEDIPVDFESDSLVGRGTLIPNKVFDKIGLFDHKKFPHYAADEDFSLRAKKAGFDLKLSSSIYLYSHIKLTGNHAGNTVGCLKYYINLFSKKSSNNIIYSNKFLITHCPKKYLVFQFLLQNFKRLFYPLYKIINK